MAILERSAIVSGRRTQRALPVLLVLAALAAGCPNHESRSAAPAPDPAAPPTSENDPALRLVVLVVFDQLPTWSFERDTELLDHGIGRLLREGIYYERGVYPFASTHTATGHAALGTGAPPAQNGILGTEWYRRESGREESSVDDAEYPIFHLAAGPSAPGGEPEVGASSRQMRVEGVADVLRRETGGKGRSVSIALKQRAAIFALGQRPDLAIWFDKEALEMTTSAFYAERPPEWLVERATQRPLRERAAEYVWEALDAGLLAKATGLPDRGPGEGGWFGLDNAFPHPLADCKKKGAALLATPLGDDIVLETALAAIEGEGLGKDDTPDLLSISFSSHDYVGHVWGQESWEHLDSLLRLDRSIAALLDALDRAVGHGRYALIFTSDHGVTRLVEQSKARGLDARRVKTADVLAAANAGARTVLGKGEWVVSLTASTLYLGPAAAQVAPEARPRALDAIVAAVSKVPGIGYVARTDRIAGHCDRRSGVEAMACKTLDAKLSGEVFVTTAPHCVLSDYSAGTGHGSPHPADSTVPLILHAPGLQAGVVREPISMLRVAPTLSRLLGVSPPRAASALPLP